MLPQSLRPDLVPPRAPGIRRFFTRLAASERIAEPQIRLARSSDACRFRVPFRRALLGLRSLVLCAMLCASPALATQVTLRVVEQLGAGVPASQFTIASQSVTQDGVVTLAPGQHSLTIFPGINGIAQTAALSRLDTVTVGLADTTISLVWSHADLTVRLVDQNAALDDSAYFQVPASGATAKDRVGAPTYHLPVTVEQPGDALYSGSFSTGYSVYMAPSINAIVQSGSLFRIEVGVELGASGLTQSFVWRRADLTVRLVDQNAALDDSATFDVPAGGAGAKDGFGVPSYHLPVTVEQAGDSPYSGPLAAGYTVKMFPSINGIPQGGSLYRDEAGVELNAPGLTQEFVWRRADLTVRLVDQNGTEDDSSFFFVPTSGLLAVGKLGTPTYWLPVTVEQAGEPPYSGLYASGYDVTVFP